MSQVANPVLRRKLGAERPVPEFGHVTPSKALSLAVSRAAQDVLRVSMSIRELAEARVSVDGMAELIPEGALCLTLRGPGAAKGLAVLDGVALTSIVEAQTRGRLDGGAIVARPPTGTDAILCNAFLSSLLRGFATQLTGHPAQDAVAGYGPAERLAGLRQLPHALQDTAYRSFTATVDIASGLRSGILVLILPWDGAPAHAAIELAAGEAAAVAWSGALRDRVLDSPAELEAVLCRITLSLAEVGTLRPGGRLALPMRCLGELSLEAREDESAGVWRLGQADGMRALRLVSADAALRGFESDTAEDGVSSSDQIASPAPVSDKLLGKPGGDEAAARSPAAKASISPDVSAGHMVPAEATMDGPS